MINPKELRLGNLVATPDGRIGPVIKISATNITLLTKNVTGKDSEWTFHDLDDPDPVPLTEEWLERLGLPKISQITWEIRPGITLWLPESSMQPWDVCRPMDKTSFCGTAKGIDYVHQLQNLYFALEGKELELKEIPA